MFGNFKKTMQALGRFSEHDLDLLCNHLNSKSFSQHDFLLKEGNICQAIYFINRGSFRQYQISEQGEDITLNLFLENDWVLNYKSFTSQKPSASIIKAEEDSDVFELGVYDLHKLVKISDSFFQIAKVLQFAIEQQENNSQSPKERYVQLLTKKPAIIQRFPLKYIASYLNMTPETLSRVRRKISLSAI